MKKYLLIFVCFVSLSAFAQDIIVKKDGTLVRAKITEVGESEVKYKKFGSTSDRVYSISTSNILSINYEDGEVEKFEASTANNSTEKQNTGSVYAVADVNANDKVVSALNSAKVAYTKKPKDKTAKYAIVQLAPKSGSVFVSNEVEVSCVVGGLNIKDKKEPFTPYKISKNSLSKNYLTNFHPALQFSISNRTEQTIYLDLANTFFVAGSNAQCYYVPGSTQTEKGQTGGVGVNVGAVTGALGVGGALGTLANGITVGGSSGSSTTSVVFNQRVVAIPPMSRITLAPKDAMDNKCFTYPENYEEYKKYSFINTQKEIKRGETLNYTEDDSPYKTSFFLTYSFTEDFAQSKKLSFGLYAKQMFGIGSYDVNSKPDYDNVTASETGLYFVNKINR